MIDPARVITDAWKRSLKIERDRKTDIGRLLAGVETRPVRIVQFGLAVEVTALPEGSLETLYLRAGEGPLLTHRGAAVWDALLRLAREFEESPVMAPGDLVGLVLGESVFRAARAALPVEGEKKEAA
ncbi:hypothetical protein [Caulobacter sp. X]|uniref:hypothetical protein n=1 Tax=Caulobacter sp. X TaxID=2048901 RepID=UPI000C14A78C|nr:hypothetical protein [Caulobacter sp. X]PIB96484.1 hypothetical protein CSW60_18420 [Caulobacter sp. X]